MRPHRLGVPELVALAAAGAVAASPWLTWYAPRVPDGLIDALSRSAGAFAPYFRAGFEAAVGHARANGWTALHGASVALLVLGLLGAVAVALAIAGHPVPREGSSAVRLAGLAALGVALYHVFRRPLPHELLALGPGAYTALAGGGALVVTGLMGLGEGRAATPPAWQAGPPPVVR